MTRLLPRRVLTGIASVATAVALLTGPAPTASANPTSPRDFTGYGFDQCLTPTQKAMNRWHQRSPFLAVGVYISGNSRWCRDQPYLTPAWVRTQLRKDWRILPITLGPQASCHPRFPRYDDDPKIRAYPGPDGDYPRARRQGRREAAKTAYAARRLGFSKGTTLWYDLEGFDFNNTHCRESALAFLDAYNLRLEREGFRPGLYSSAASGIKMVDNARVYRRGQFHLPEQIWIADWDGRANVSSTYVREDGWRGPRHGRVKQYRGGHDETWGGVTINIDSNYLVTGRGSWAGPEPAHCGGLRINWSNYPPLRADIGSRRPGTVKVLQCLLQEKGYYEGPISGHYSAATIQAMRAWDADHGLPPRDYVTRGHWVALLADGPARVLKVGSTGPVVRRLQRSLNAARFENELRITGVYDEATADAVRAYQRRYRVEVNGVANRQVWPRLLDGRR